MTSEMLEKLDLSQSSFGEDLFAKDVGHLLDCDALFILAIRGSATIESVLSCGYARFLTYQTIPYAP